MEARLLLAFDLVAAYADGIDPFYVKGGNASILTVAPQQITLRFNPGVSIDPATLSGNVSVVSTIGGGVVDVGLSVDDLPNENQVIVRFKEALRDGSYRINVGSGLGSLAPADSATATTLNVQVDLGAFVIGVNPQPVVRAAAGGLSHARNQIQVYFNTEDPLNTASAQNPALYRLFAVNEATNADEARAGIPVGGVAPTGVIYSDTLGRATLQFGTNLSTADGLYRLEIGGRPAASPVAIGAGSDDNSSFTTARDIGALGADGATVQAAIELRPTLPTPVGQLGFPSPPGALDTPGHRDVPVDSGRHGVPDFVVVDPLSSITTVRYDFREIIGQDPQGNDLQNVITEAQKQRAREIFELFSLSSGIRFVEVGYDPLVPSLMVATGDLRAFNPNANSGSIAGLGGGAGALMNALLNWGDSEYGGSWFQVAMHEIGHALGLGHTYDLPSVMGADLGGEGIFPGDYDIEHLRQLYPNRGTDIDVYRFSLAQRGFLTAETVVARPGLPVTSRLDTVLSLYREEVVGGKTVRTLVARNDDFYGRDSFVGLDLEAGTYFVAVSSTGNTSFDPAISDSGAGGRTEGDYRLDLRFTPAHESANPVTIVDRTGRPLDGDRDGRADGVFKFWFRAAPETRTIYVDKANAAAGNGNGSRTSPFKTIRDALAATQTLPAGTRIIRIAGTAAAPYQIGTDLTGRPLADGTTFNVPAGVTVMIDGDATFKLRGAIIDVGSSSQLVSRAAAAIQVLGIPSSGTSAGRPVTFTSWHDDSIGGNSDGFGPAAQGGQWGGIVLRQDSDAASRGAFVNSITGADIRYGGGQVRVDSQIESFAPIQVESTRPSVLFNRIRNSAGAGIAATPNSFEDTGDRVGPEFRGNRLTDNTVNGLFLKIETQFGTPIDQLDVPARFRSNDIVYVLQENLIVSGGIGGYVDRVTRLGNLAAGSPVVTGLVTTADLQVGMQVEIRDPANPDVSALAGPATIVSIDTLNRSVTLSETAVVTRSFASVTFIEPNLGFARRSGRLAIDPGVVIKLQDARIELERGLAQLVAEGLPGKSVIFTSFGDNRYGAGGSFDTNGNVPDKFDATGRPVGTLTVGDWGGIVVNAGAKASIDRAYIAFGGGETPIEGGFDNFNVIEVHQGDLRVANSRIEANASGLARTNRTGRGGNADATVFVRGAQPIVVGNDFRANQGAVISINANALSDVQRGDVGRTTGDVSRHMGSDDNFGPLVRGNVLQYGTGGQAVAGMVVRGGEITVESVWDDVDIVHVLRDEITVQNFHTATGVRLLSKPDASLVVKLQGASAGFTAAGEYLDIDDRIGGTVQLVGQPGYPVVMTSLLDDSAGASVDPRGRPVTDTNTDGGATTPGAGDWRSLRFLPFSNDRNVTIYAERELAHTGGIDANQATDAAEWLGVLGPNYAASNNTWESAQEKNGDENRRLGFEVHGNVAYDDPTDVDIYTFMGYAGSEVWVDVDKTSPRLDAMVELLDAAGNVLARSVDGAAEGGVIQGEVIAGQVVGSDATYQLVPPALAPGQFTVVAGTLTGVLYEVDAVVGPIAVQTFAVDADGIVTFHNILGSDRLGDPNGIPVAAGGSGSYATDGLLDPATGLLSLTFSGGGMPASQVEVRYSYESAALTAVAGIGRTLGKDAHRGGDYFSHSPRDPGMRLILPGSQGVQTRYFLRVRSQPRYEPTTTGVDNGSVTATTEAEYRTAVADPAGVKTGATSGRYELRVRLRQRDEKPGSTVRYADIRYPTIGIDVQGLPANSPLVAETAENPTDNNGSFAGAQYIGNVLESNRNALSVAGTVSAEADVDWYTFALNYEQLQSIAGVNDGPYSWSGVFDIDYADGFRGDLTISVFDENGRLLYVGRDSDVSDDQPGPSQGTDFDDLSKGSLGKLDALIGTVDLTAGGPTGGGGTETGLPPTPPDPARQLRYYVAISSNERLPTQLNATFTSAAANAVVRLEPVAAVDRVVVDRIGVAGVPANELLIDTANLAAHARPFTLADVTLFVTTASSLVTVDAMRDAALLGGGVETTIVGNYGAATTIGDLIMRSDGNLYVYRGLNNDASTAGQLARVDSGTGTATVVGNDQVKSPIAATQNNLAPTQTGTVAVTSFDLTGTFLRPPQDAPITGAVRYQRLDTSTNPDVTRVGNWTFTAAAPTAINGIATLNFTPGAVDPQLGNAPVAGTINLETGIVNVTWATSAAAANFSLTSIDYQYTFQDVATDLVDAVAWRRAAVGNYQNLVYSVWDPANNQSLLYQANPTSGSAAYVANQNWGIQGTLAAVGGRVRGLAWLDGTLYGAADNGEFFSIDDLNDGDFDVTITPIATLAGTAFAGLAVGPQNLAGEAVPDNDPANDVAGYYSNFLFAIDDVGTLTCLDTLGGLQAVFDADGDGIAEATSINTGVGGATGLAFSPLDINLWHTTTRRSGDAGGGTGPDDTQSMWFGLENTGVQFAGSAAWQQDLLSNAAIGDNYNLPGGAYGSLVTNPFDLTDYSYTDKPTLYFDYWLATQGAASRGTGMRDSARVLASIDGGLTWELVATNNSVLSTADSSDAELPAFASVSSKISNDALIENQHVQELFDTANWRQARIDLGKFAGQGDIRLRFDFSTAGRFDDTQQTADIDGDGINDLINTIVNDTTGNFGPTPGLANTTGDFGSAERGQNNQFEGFYIDDIVIGFAERGEAVTGATAAATAFFDVGTPAPSDTVPAQVLNGPYQLEIRRGTTLGVVTLPDGTTIPETVNTNDRLIAQRSTTGGYGVRLGDMNQPREQGQFLIESNIISAAAEYGIRIDAAARDGGSNAPHPGSPRSLPTPNNSRLAPGVVVANNVVARSGTAGILFSGDPNTGNVPTAAVPFGRLVNNTFYGGATPAGTGIQVTDNASPTLLNNLFANLARGIAVDSSSAARTPVVGTSAYWNTATQVSGVSQSNQIALTGDPFVNAATGNFYLAAGSRAIDSSLNTLQDRNEFVVVNSPLGISASPIVAPNLDLYGQLRSDDPGVTNLSGLGSNVFKDRGAIDRVDFSQPRARLEVPLDNASPDADPAPDSIRLERDSARAILRFVLHLDDEGVGIDPATVTSAAFVLSRNGVDLQAGVDYDFIYRPAVKEVAFEGASVFSPADYAIRITQEIMGGQPVNMVRDLAGNPLLSNQADGTTRFSIQLADVPAAPQNLIATSGDGQIGLTWLAASNGGSPLVRYEVQRATNAAFTAGLANLNASPTTLATTILPLTNGMSYWFRVRAVNSLGAGDWSIVAGPAVPLNAPTLALTADSGRLPSDAVTNDGRVTVSGLLAGATWQYSTNGGASWTAGTGSQFLLPEGIHPTGQVRVRQAMLTSTSPSNGNPMTWTVDLTRPAAAGLSLGAGVMSPVSRAEALLAAGVIAVTGESTAAITAVFTRGAVTLPAKTRIGSGGITLTSADLTALGDGLITVTATQADLAGNQQSAPAAILQFTLDATAPAAPVITAVVSDVAPNFGTVANGGRTNDVRPTINGTAEPGSALTILINGTAIPGTVTADGVGGWSVTTDTLANGTCVITAQATDAAGNTSVASAPYGIVIDTVAPAAPVIVSIIDDVPEGTGVVPNGGRTNDTRPTISGTAEAGSTVTVLLNGVALAATAVASGTGNWSLTTVALADGTYAVTARATDVAGNPGTVSIPYTITIDTVAPAAPAITGVSDDAAPLTGNVPSGGRTNDTTPTVSGTAEAGSRVTVLLNGTAAPTTAVASSTGLWSIPLGPLANAAYAITAVASDAAGNRSVNASPAYSLTVDTVAPTITSMTAASGTYTAGQSIAITATLSDALRAGGVVVIGLNSGASVTLTAVGNTSTASGTYVVQPGDRTGALKATSITVSTSNGILDLAGNALVSITLPADSSNFGSGTTVVIDGSVSLLPVPPRFSTNPNQVANAGISVTEVPVRFTTPVTGVTLAAFELSLDGRPVSLRDATLSGTGDSYVLRLPALRANPSGIYQLVVRQDTGIRSTINGVTMIAAGRLYWGKDRSVVQTQTTIESAGAVTLSADSSGNLKANATPITFNGVAVQRDTSPTATWRYVAAENVGGVNSVLLRNSGGNVLIWRMNTAWNYVSDGGWFAPGTPQFFSTEVAFGVDVDGNGAIGAPGSVIEWAGFVTLSTDPTGTVRANGIAITYGGAALSQDASPNATWRFIAAETVNGVNSVLLRHSSGSILVWRMDASWNYTSDGGWFTPGSAGFLATELTFGVDANGNGMIGG